MQTVKWRILGSKTVLFFQWFLNWALEYYMPQEEKENKKKRLAEQHEHGIQSLLSNWHMNSLYDASNDIWNGVKDYTILPYQSNRILTFATQNKK